MLLLCCIKVAINARKDEKVMVLVLVDSPVTLLTTWEASSLMIKTDAAVTPSVCVAKVTKIERVHFVYLCEAGTPNTWSAETSAGVRA